MAQTTQGGAATTLGYTNPGNPFLATTTTTDSQAATAADKTSTTVTYNGTGNPLTSTYAVAAQAALTYNSNGNGNGTVVSATAPGNGTNARTYLYTNNQITSSTPPTGTTLGPLAMSYDLYGRLATSSDRRGITTTYSYDKNDRQVGVDYSGTTANPDVAFTYDGAGRLATRVAAAGTTTYGYDQMSRLTSRVNTADGVAVAYGYDKASRVAAVTDARGTTTNAYDSAGAQTSMVYNAGGGTQTTQFRVDEKNRRTDTWMLTNPGNTGWAAHSHTDYDPSGRPSRVFAERNTPSSSAGAATAVVDLSYCYSAGSVAPACSTVKTDDRSLVQWMKNAITGQVATYTYTARRLTGVTQTGGTDNAGAAILPVTYAYTYDLRGNRTNETITTGTGGTATTTVKDRTFNPGNQTTTAGFTFDGAGNQSADPAAGAMTYTAGDQMASVTRAGYSYNYTYAGVGNGELLSNQTPTANYAYTYGRTNAQGKPIIEQVHRGTDTAFMENDATGTPIMIRTSAGMQALYVYDNSGSPVALITSANTTAFAYSFDPYGTATTTTTTGGNGEPQTPFLYTGGLNDRTTGWTLNGARYHNPSEGRWTQHDTLDAPLASRFHGAVE